MVELEAQLYASMRLLPTTGGGVVDPSMEGQVPDPESSHLKLGKKFLSNDVPNFASRDNRKRLLGLGFSWAMVMVRVGVYCLFVA